MAKIKSDQSFTCLECGNTNPNKTKFYEGALGYDAIVCTECGAFSDHLGFFPANEWSLWFVGIKHNSDVDKTLAEKITKEGRDIIEKALMEIGVEDEPSIDMDILEIQFDEKPNGAVIRVNNVNGCVLRICGIPKELVFDENGEVRSFVDIAYPRNK